MSECQLVILDRVPFVFDYRANEQIIATMFQGYHTQVKRIVFSDAEAWHVYRIRVGLPDQLEVGGVNASVLADNCEAIIDRVLPGLMLTINFRRAENFSLTAGEVIFYGYRLDG